METKTSLEQRTIEPIVLDNLALDGEAVRGDEGEYLIKNQHDWMDYSAGSGARLPTLPEYFAFIHHLQKEKHPASKALLKDLRKSALCVGTQFGYHNNAITHFWDETRVISCAIPTREGYLDKLVKDDAWRKVVQTAFGHPDADEVVEVLQKFSGRLPYIWTPSADGRKSNPERAAWLNSDTDGFCLNCDNDPIYSGGRARRVRRVEGCETSRAKNEESNNCSQKQHPVRNHTYEEILTIAKPLVAKPLWDSFIKIVPREAPVTGDILQRTADEQYMSLHSWKAFKNEMEKLK